MVTKLKSKVARAMLGCMKKNIVLILIFILLVSCNTSNFNPLTFPVKMDSLQNKSINLKLLTLNTEGLPGIIGKDKKERMIRIGKSIKEYDIAALQETFTDYSTLIVDYSGFPFSYRHDNGSLLKFNSGLYMFSKYKINRTNYKEFSDCKGYDCFSRKSVLLTSISIPVIGDVNFYNLHLQSNSDKEDVRLKQIEEVIKFVKETAQNRLSFIFGDFNTTEDLSVYKKFRKELKLIDTFRAANPDSPGYSYNPILNTLADKDEKPSRYDYIFVALNENYEVKIVESVLTHTKPVDGYWVSDHFGVSSSVNISE